MHDPKTLNIQPPILLDRIEEVDLSGHSVIEASAGTGKTHTLTNLVVNILKQGLVSSLEQILIVTFTDKAAGELRIKIRRILEETISRERIPAVQEALDNFDSASIYTIHGFCQRVLQLYAFENGERFTYELRDDKEIYPRVLASLMREEWPASYGAHFKEVLQLAGFPSVNNATGESSLEDLITGIALRYQPAAGDEIRPARVPDFPGRLRRVEADLRACCDRLSKLVGNIDESNLAASEFALAYARLNIAKNSMGKRLRILGALLGFVAGHRRQPATLDRCEQFLDRLGSKDIGADGFRVLMSGWKKPGPDYEEKLPALAEAVELLERIRELDFASLRMELPVWSIQQLKKGASAYKDRHGFISYDDMISLVSAALERERTALKSLLRERYVYALVDEFQDTDMLQWRIFRSIFLEGPANRLVIIGDPKQAIYGFRGADIYAYFTAKAAMIGEYGARYYSLHQNWRSTPELIGSFNTLFGDEDWFGAPEISYIDNTYPKEKRAAAGGDSRPGFVVADLGPGSGSHARSRMASYIAREIELLLADPARPMAAGEIAVLLRKWTEAPAIEQALRERGIPYSYYKKEGLFQSMEAINCATLLHALRDPRDEGAYKKALLTDFFAIPLEALGDASIMDPAHPARARFNRWSGMAEQKRWGAFFQSLMSGSGIPLRLLDAVQDERAYAAYRQICNVLVEFAYREKATIGDLVAFLDELISQPGSGDPARNLHALETDEPRVQLLTIHASKGLQFRAVFIGGGFTSKERNEFSVYHAAGKRIFDLSGDAAGSALYEREREQEEARLFYVALTRAQERLYVPYFEPSRHGSSTAGIVGKKLALALKRLAAGTQLEWLRVEDAAGPDPRGVARPSTDKRQVAIPVPLFVDQERHFLDRSIPIGSFSSIQHRHATGHADEISPADSLLIDDDPLTPLPAAEDQPALREPGLPPGTATGLLMHDLLEHLDFPRSAKEAGPALLSAPGNVTGDLIREKVAAYLAPTDPEQAAAYCNEVAGILWHTLNAPLDAAGLTLGAPGLRKMHEMEFYWDPSVTGLPDHPVPGISRSGGGLLHGIVDLLFEHAGKIYILDWKSNFLADGYDSEALAASIRLSKYDLQYTIYSLAAIQWLRLSMPGFDYDTHFGGVYYLYLRGMRVDEPGKGVFFHRPESEDALMRHLGEAL